MYMSDFNVNNEVIHCREGLSTIIGSKEMNGKEYFLVQVNRISGETFYVPVDSANSIIRHIMTVEEADELLKLVKTSTQTPNKEEMLIRRDYLLAMLKILLIYIVNYSFITN